MGLDDIWNELQYIWIDLTNYTYAEGQAAKYRKVVEALAKKIPGCEDQLEKAQKTGTDFHNQFLRNSDSAAGEGLRYFTSQEEVWRGNKGVAAGSMATAINTAWMRYEAASQSLTAWEEEVTAEETTIREDLWNQQEEKRKESESTW